MILDFEKLIEECKFVEYKETISEGFFKTVSAFSNTDGGCIILGVQDRTKIITGIELSDGKQEAIINKIIDYNGVQPDIEYFEIDNKTILKIIIEKSQNPIQYKGYYYKRVGNTTRKVTQEELKKLLLRDVSWDSLKNNCTINDIDENSVKSFVKLAVNSNRLADEVISYTVEEVLGHLGLMIDGKPVNGAVLLFGKNPQKFFKKVDVRIGLFKGNNEDTIIGDKIITGNLFNQIKECETVLKSFINVRYDIRGLNRTEVWDYPIVAIREALLNAIIHRDYHDFGSDIQIKIFDDYIWFYNPGELFGGLTLEQLKKSHPSKSRNPLIMDVIYKAKYVEQFGTGIKRMTQACLKQGMPAPRFECSSSGFSLQIDKEYKNVNERQKTAIKYLVENEYITNSIYQNLNNCSRDISKRDLKKLVELGILDNTGDNKLSKYFFKLL